MHHQSILKEFNKFAGKEVQVTQVVHKRIRRGVEETMTETMLDPNDPVIAEMNHVAEVHGMILRTSLPGQMGTDDARWDRVNVDIEKDNDGKYRVRKNFNIG